MSDSFENLIDIILAVLIMFLFPLIYIGQKQDALVQTYISAETDSLTGEIRSKGYLTKEMYDLYQEQLSRTGMLYDVMIEHRHLVNEPEYRFRTAEEVKEEQDTAYTGTNILTQMPISTDLPEVSDPVTGTLNTETNESVLASAVSTPASPSHAHTDACYLGTKHVHTGSPSSGGGCYSGSSATHQCSGTLSYDHQEIQQFDRNCSACGGVGTVHYIALFHYYKCSAWPSHTLSVTAFWDRECSNCGDKYSFQSQAWYGGSQCWYQYQSYSLNCGKIEGHYYNGNTEAFPICNQIVTVIVPTNPVQTVAVGDPLITTVTATYQDGSTKVVVGTSTFSTANPVQNQTATITYSYTLNGTTYTKSCTIIVTVIPRSKTCPNGHTYNLNADGTDPGCPYCRSWLQSLTFVYPTTGNITIYKGTTLPDNGVELLASYMDGHTQHIYNEYVDNLDNQYVGVQTVTLSYKGHYLYLTVTTKRNLRLCPVCNRYYELYPDGTDPGCPFCMALTPIFTGNIMTYYNDYYTDFILKELYEGSGIYYFSDRDFIEVSIKNGRESLGSRILSFFGTGVPGMQAISSGYVREEGKPQ